MNPVLEAPQRSYQQRIDALQNANKIRTFRKELKQDLKAGRTSIHDLLLDPPEEIETMKLVELLLSVPKYGRVKVNKYIVACRVSHSKTVGGLSQRQRTELVSMLRR